MRHKELDVWNVSMTLVEFVHDITKSFPQEELFGLVTQMRRSSIAIPSNIAEGHGRFSNKSYRYFLTVAYGSLLELDTQLQISMKFNYINDHQYHEMNELVIRISQMLYKLIKKFENITK